MQHRKSLDLEDLFQHHRHHHLEVDKHGDSPTLERAHQNHVSVGCSSWWLKIMYSCKEYLDFMLTDLFHLQRWLSWLNNGCVVVFVVGELLFPKRYDHLQFSLRSEAWKAQPDCTPPHQSEVSSLCLFYSSEWVDLTVTLFLCVLYPLNYAQVQWFFSFTLYLFS